MPAASGPDSTSGRRLSERTLAVTSVAIAVYLVGLVLTIAGNSVSGSSALVRTIKQRLFSVWMAPAWLDLGFDHPLTYGLPADADHGLEIRRFSEPGSPLRLPGDRTGERAARWRRLAGRIAAAGEDDVGVAVAAGVGQGAFRALEADDVVVRAVRWPLEDRASQAAAPRSVKPYEARVRLVDGEIQLVELGGEAKRPELAPVVRGDEGSPRPARQEAKP